MNKKPADSGSVPVPPTEYIAKMAHKINNPNTIIMINSETLGDILEDVLAFLDSFEDADSLWVGNFKLEEIKTIIPSLLVEIKEGSRRIKINVDELREYAGKLAPGTPSGEQDK